MMMMVVVVMMILLMVIGELKEGLWFLCHLGCVLPACDHCNFLSMARIAAFVSMILNVLTEYEKPMQVVLSSH